MDYTCPLCSGTFSHKTNLFRHLRNKVCSEMSSTDDSEDLIEQVMREVDDRTFDDRLDEGFRMVSEDGVYDDELTEEDEED